MSAQDAADSHEECRGGAVRGKPVEYYGVVLIKKAEGSRAVDIGIS
jgi:hypothetical protein